MPDKYLKRFEKLENTPIDILLKEGLKISKRFERLEIGDKKIEVAITDVVLQQEKAPADIEYFIICPYCSAQNKYKDEICTVCKRVLGGTFPDGFNKEEHFFKRCSCGAVSKKDKKNCWICGKHFSESGGKDQENRSNDSSNVIILNINGKEYRSTDQDLPLDIRMLMEKIRREGYKKEIVDQWMAEKNSSVESRDRERNSRLFEIQVGLTWRIAALILLFMFMFFQLRACFRF